MLNPTDLTNLTTLRRTLHRRPELSGYEVETARTITDALHALAPTQVITGLGGHGVAAVFDSGSPGPTVLFRAELDALPITETSDRPWVSGIPGKGHLCGHDGHMAMLLGLGWLIARRPPRIGAYRLAVPACRRNWCRRAGGDRRPRLCHDYPRLCLCDP